ncbi:putative metallo-peptidase, Clan MC, Family M14 [Trypanosoma cruzi]|uniref:Zinc carboxypeptidase, putative n=2 Tax=Trypanosoma cruzi TaxID=5693 RepID=Q4D725_TRYCC|nr:zinc carboxypeptidase, putative [Trypanosoma cruzi]EAN88326.1 zinc carboxypeptidase, putative [Trypanosoma cruzi]PWU92646.1 putative metallo-peptidase, Clan MC, Family M14 [Trypanosoma cruzi]|eukprot:XP_810177.1 zinc carboxypeptidase [Trypanosoma cruzi strain CL Brener]
MPVKLEKSSTVKGARRAQKDEAKMEVFDPFTSQLGMIPSRILTTMDTASKKLRHTNTNSSNASNQNRRNPSANAMASSPVVLKSHSVTRKKNELHVSLFAEGRRRRSSGLLRRPFFESSSVAEETPGKTGPASEPSYDLAFSAVDETTIAVAAAPGEAAATPRRTRNNNGMRDASQQHVEGKAPSPQPVKIDAGIGVDGNQPSNQRVPSECSSLNSSIAHTPCNKEKRGIKKQTLEENQDREQSLGNNNAFLFSFEGNDLERYTPYDEETEEKAVHRYMEKTQTTDTPWEGRKSEVSTCDSILHSSPKKALDAEVISIDNSRSSLRSRSVRRRLLRGQTFMKAKTRGGTVHRRSIRRTIAEGISDATCRSMSLYNAFFLDDAKKVWLVDDFVLARCLDYVGLMGYEQLMPNGDQASQDLLSGMTVGQMRSPIIHAPQELNRGNGGANRVRSSRWVLNGEPCNKYARTGGSTLFLHPLESERWLSEQEYVLAVVFSCCAWADVHRRFSANKSNNNKNKNKNSSGNDGNDNVEPYFSPDWHPIRQTAALVLERFPHFGDAAEFVENWERQVSVVLGTASLSHQRVFQFPGEGLVFSSDLEGGNLARVERLKGTPCQPAFTLWLGPEFGCAQRLWFRFAILGVRPQCAISLRIVNIQPNTKLYARNGMRPVWRAGNSPRLWTPVGACVYRTINNDEDGELSFVLLPRSSDVVHVAFCVPYTYADLLCHITHWHQLVKMSISGIRFEERVLCHTRDGRKLHLLIITSANNKKLLRRNSRHEKEGNNFSRPSILGPYGRFETGKKVVLLSGRVHPGEVTASHGIHGVISFLLSRDPRAALVREYFIFYIVPMLNPDGVARGHSRLDQNGFNLNRCYKNPDPQIQPTVAALRKVFDYLQKTYLDRFFMYMDFHSHASQSSGFMFGNCLPDTVQHWNMIFPKIVSLHAKGVFSYQLCRFGRGHMTSKEGSSRVLFGERLIHSYTVELTHFSNNRMYIDGACGDDENNVNDRNYSIASCYGDNDTWEARYANIRGARLRWATRSQSEKGTWPLPGAVKTRSRSKRGRKQASSRQGISKRTGQSDGKAGKRGSKNAASKDEPFCFIETPCILSQSAEVGRACVLALLDYCGVGNEASAQLIDYGGIERTLREVRRSIHSTVTPRPPANRVQLNIRQH